MNDLDCIEYAIQIVLEKCRKANPNHMQTPADGASVMEWLAHAINEAKEIRDV